MLYSIIMFAVYSEVRVAVRTDKQALRRGYSPPPPPSRLLKSESRWLFLPDNNILLTVLFKGEGVTYLHAVYMYYVKPVAGCGGLRVLLLLMFDLIA